MGRTRSRQINSARHSADPRVIQSQPGDMVSPRRCQWSAAGGRRAAFRHLPTDGPDRTDGPDQAVRRAVGEPNRPGSPHVPARAHTWHRPGRPASPAVPTRWVLLDGLWMGKDRSYWGLPQKLGTEASERVKPLQQGLRNRVSRVSTCSP